MSIKLHPGMLITYTVQQLKSKRETIKTGVPQEGVLSPTLSNLYTFDIWTPQNYKIKLVTYADDIKILSRHTNINTVKQQVHPYLEDMFNWIIQNNLIRNPS